MCLPGSVELWVKRVYERVENGNDQSEITDLLEEAVVSAGEGWDSSNLWSLYSIYMVNIDDIAGALSVHLRAVTVASSGLQQQVDCIEKFLVKHSPDQEVEVMQEVKKGLCETQKEVEKRSDFESLLINNSKYSKDVAIYLKYVEYLKEKGSNNEVRLIYERCLARCCREEELWLKWVQWEQEQGDMDDVESVLIRGQMCLPQSLPLHLIQAEYKEEIGQFEEAHAILSKHATNYPDPLSRARLQIIHMEIRQGSSKEQVKELFIEALRNSTDQKNASEIILKLSQYLQTKGSSIEAIEILAQGILNNTKHKGSS